MTNILRFHRRKFIAGGVLAGLVYLPYSPLADSFRTPGVRNIEDRYSSAGGGKHSTPGAATKRGDSEDVVGGHAGAPTAIGTEAWEEKIGDQRPDPSKFDKAWNKTHYGAEKGK